MKEYKCNICNRNHAVYYSSESPMPTELSDFESREDIVQLTENAFVIQKKFLLISGDIKIDTELDELEIYHRVWVRIVATDFYERYEKLSNGSSITMKSEILSELPFYPNSKGLKADYTLHLSSYGLIEVKSESELKNDQKQPISKERIIQLMENLNHSGDKDKQDFTKPFDERLNNYLERAQKEFQSNGKLFVINVSTSDNVLFQIVSSAMLIKPSEEGFGLHISNDETNDEYKRVKSSLVNLQENINLDILQLDEINTYQKWYTWNDKKITDDIGQIISEIYNESKEKIDLEIFEP